MQQKVQNLYVNAPINDSEAEEFPSDNGDGSDKVEDRGEYGEGHGVTEKRYNTMFSSKCL